MSQVSSGLLYTKEHEWVKVVSDTRVQVGITDFAQHQLGDIVFVELPALHSQVKAEESVGSVESVKTVSDIYCPVSGKVVAVNDVLEASPELVNSNPYEDGWMFEIEISGREALAGLLSSEEYEAHTGDSH